MINYLRRLCNYPLINECFIASKLTGFFFKKKQFVGHVINVFSVWL